MHLITNVFEKIGKEGEWDMFVSTSMESSRKITTESFVTRSKKKDILDAPVLGIEPRAARIISL